MFTRYANTTPCRGRLHLWIASLNVLQRPMIVASCKEIDKDCVSQFVPECRSNQRCYQLGFREISGTAAEQESKRSGLRRDLRSNSFCSVCVSFRCYLISRYINLFSSYLQTSKRLPNVFAPVSFVKHLSSVRSKECENWGEGGMTHQ